VDIKEDTGRSPVAHGECAYDKLCITKGSKRQCGIVGISANDSCRLCRATKW